MAASRSLTPAERSERARAAAHIRWAKEPDRLAATAAGLKAAFQKLLDEVDPHGRLAEAERIKRAKNLQQAQLAQARLAASKARRRRTAGTAGAGGERGRPTTRAPEGGPVAPAGGQE
jgi:hypothetical protein